MKPLKGAYLSVVSNPSVFHLNRAMDNGLTQTEAGEVLTHLAFYAVWPNAFSAAPVAQGVFENRPE